MTKSTIKRISVDEIHEDIQRLEGMDAKRVARYADSFNENALGVITVSQRNDGGIFVLDGRHRWAASRLAGHDKPIHARVISGLTRAAEADLFIALNDMKAVSAISKFHAAVIAEYPAEVEMNSIVEANGWKISLSGEDGHLSAVSALDRLYRGAAIGNVKQGPHPELTAKVVQIITNAWEWDRKSVDSPVLLGVGQLFARFGNQVDEVKLLKEMRETRPGTLIGKAKALRDVQGGTVPAAFAKVLVGMHNKKRRTNLLPEWVWTR